MPSLPTGRMVRRGAYAETSAHATDEKYGIAWVARMPIHSRLSYCVGIIFITPNAAMMIASSISPSSRTAPTHANGLFFFPVCQLFGVTTKVPVFCTRPAMMPRAIACESAIDAIDAPITSRHPHGTRAR